MNNLNCIYDHFAVCFVYIYQPIEETENRVTPLKIKKNKYSVGIGRKGDQNEADLGSDIGQMLTFSGISEVKESVLIKKVPLPCFSISTNLSYCFLKELTLRLVTT